jgi:hypothetical protein
MGKIDWDKLITIKDLKRLHDEGWDNYKATNSLKFLTLGYFHQRIIDHLKSREGI